MMILILLSKESEVRRLYGDLEPISDEAVCGSLMNKWVEL